MGVLPPAGSPAQNLEIAQQLYERALALDPEFALAYVALSEVHGWVHWIRYDTSPQQIEQQREAAPRLAPELPDARVTMGLFHYFCQRDYPAALTEFRIAL